MRLYLVQHGQAVDEALDPERPLTERGRNETQRVSNRLKDAAVPVDRIWHSGKTRARETAEIIRRSGTANVPMEMREGLKPKDDVERLQRIILRMNENVMIVGHMPFLVRLAALLLTGDADHDIVQFQYSAVACLERGRDGRWRLVWMLTPDFA